MKSKLKYLLLTLLIGFISNDFVRAQSLSVLADSAQKAYEKQHFQTSISFYEKILNQGNTSASLHYNLGNAYFRTNQLGKAIYNYEIAKKLNPNDEDILFNLRIASAKTVDKIDVKENFFVNTVKSNIYTYFTTNEWAWISILLTASALFFFALYICARNTALKRFGFWSGSLLGIATIVVFIIGFAALHNLQKKSQAVILAQTVQVFNAPNESGKSQFSLHEGTKVNVLETKEQWSSVKLDNGNEGWVKTTEIGMF
jgi:tetratricopeptide (TPR) repeat protein